MNPHCIWCIAFPNNIAVVRKGKERLKEQKENTLKVSYCGRQHQYGDFRFEQQGGFRDDLWAEPISAPHQSRAARGDPKEPAAPELCCEWHWVCSRRVELRKRSTTALQQISLCGHGGAHRAAVAAAWRRHSPWVPPTGAAWAGAASYMVSHGISLWPV